LVIDIFDIKIIIAVLSLRPRALQSAAVLIRRFFPTGAAAAAVTAALVDTGVSFGAAVALIRRFGADPALRLDRHGRGSGAGLEMVAGGCGGTAAAGH
jgi:hypothetical protein